MTKRIRGKYLLACVFAALCAAALLLPLRAICDNEELTIGLICPIIDFSQYAKLSADIRGYRGYLYQNSRTGVPSEPLISYLERQEKSPPT